MATESKDVELRVRARDYSRKTLEDVTKSLDDLTKAQAAQLDGAKKGEVSAKALADSYTKIEDAVKALINQNALTKTFEAQAEALQLSKDKADQARVAQDAYAKSLEGVDEKTKKQIATQTKLANAVAKADGAQLNAQTRLDRTVAKLDELGIATNDIVGAQKRMADGVAVGNAALERQSAALDTVEQDTRTAANAAVEAAALKKKASEDEALSLKLVAAAAAAAVAAQQRNTAAAVAANKARTDQLVAERAVVSAMRASAQQAEASAKGYATLARSVKSVRGDELASQLKAITDPAEVANDNLIGLTNNVKALGNVVGSINGPVKAFRATLASLEATQKGAAGIAAQIDAYRRQIDVLRAARTEYSQAQTAVRNLTTAMRAGGGDAAELSKQLNLAQSALKAAATNISQQVNVTRELRTALRAAGIDTRNLSDAQLKLVANVTSAKNSINTLSDAYKKNGAAAEGAAKGGIKFFDSTRTTLGYAQRLRGELIGLATAYIGIQGAIGTATGALEAFKTAQKVEGQLGAAFGTDAAVIRKEWDYLMSTANRIGISFKEAAPAYAKFAIAAKAFGFTGDELRSTFEGLAKASTVAGLSGYEFEGVMKAVEQMMSKGSITAEELRGQVGERLPGVFVLLADSMGVTTEKLTELMAAGEVGPERLLKFSNDLGKTFVLTESKLNSLQAAQNRYNNALFEFQLAVANSGFADAFSGLLVSLTNLMNSGEGEAFARGLSEAFTGVVDVIRFLITHTDELKMVMSALTGILVAKWAFAAYTGFASLVTIVGGLFKSTTAAIAVLKTAGGVATAAGVAAGGAAGGVRLLGLAFRGLLGPIGLVLIAIEAAIFAYDRLGGAKSRAMGGVVSGGGGEFKGNGATGSWGTDAGPAKSDGPGVMALTAKRVAENAAKEAEKRQTKLDRDRRSALKKSAKDELAERADLIKDEYKLLRDATTAQITNAEDRSKALLTIDKQEKQALETDAIRFNAENAKSGASAANKEISLKETVKNALLKIQDDITAAEVKADSNATFDERKKARLDAISHSYDKLKKSIKQLEGMDKAGAADASKKLESYIGQLKAVEEIKVTTDEVKRLEKELDDQMKLRQSGLDRETVMYENGLRTQEEFLANTKAINQKGDDAVTVAANNLQNFVDAAVKAKAGIMSLTDQAEVNVKTTTAVAGSSNTGSKNADVSNKLQEEAIDNLVSKRGAAEQIFKAQFDLRMISEDEYAAKVNANSDVYKSKILELNAALLAQLETQRAQGILEGTLNPARLAALDAQIAKQQLLGTTVANAIPTADTLGRTLASGLGSGIDSALNGLVDGLTNLAKGTTDVAGGFQAMAQSALSAFAQVLQQIAMAIAKQLILNAIASSYGGGTVLGGVARALGGTAGVNHRGGIVGAANGTKRAVDPSWFAGAPRFHEGGFPGLKSDEVPSILQKGEEVLARNDPRNVLNGAAAESRGSGNRFVLVDDRSKIPEAMQSAEGERVTLVNIRKNAATIKQLLK